MNDATTSSRQPTSMRSLTEEEHRLVEEAEGRVNWIAHQTEAAFALLGTLAEPDPAVSVIGWPSALEHSLQAATRAARDGQDEELVVTLLLHDAFDGIAGDRHSELAAEWLRPYLSEELHWILRHHGVFQKHNYLHAPEELRNARDRYRDHPLFDRTAEFCERYDQNSFDPGYESLPLEHFRPMVERFFGRAPSAY